MGAARFDGGGGGVAVPREHWPRRPGDTISTKERENRLKSEILKNEMKNQCLFAAAILADRTPSARKWRNYFCAAVVFRSNSGITVVAFMAAHCLCRCRVMILSGTLSCFTNGVQLSRKHRTAFAANSTGTFKFTTFHLSVHSFFLFFFFQFFHSLHSVLFVR